MLAPAILKLDPAEQFLLFSTTIFYYIFSFFSFDNKMKARELINLIDTLFYVYAGDSDIDFELFKRIFQTIRVSIKNQVMY